MSRFNIIKDLHGLELKKERIRSFKKIVLLEVILILMALLLPETLQILGFDNYVLICELIFPMFIMFVIVLWWDMLRIYLKSKKLIIFLLLLMIGVFLSNLILLNPINPLLTGDAFKLFSLLFMFFMLLIEAILIRVTILEIFTNKLPIKENLLGAVFIYLTTGIAFASIFTIMQIVDNASFLINVPASPIFYQVVLGYSFMILGGVDHSYNLSQLVLHVSAVEAVIGNLFIVFVVGRLFTQQGSGE